MFLEHLILDYMAESRPGRDRIRARIVISQLESIFPVRRLRSQSSAITRKTDEGEMLHTGISDAHEGKDAVETHDDRQLNAAEPCGSVKAITTIILRS